MCNPSFPRCGSVLLFMIAVMTVMLIVAFAFVRTMQMTRGTSSIQRRDDLAHLAAEMGMQHAIAVALHEYAMPSEVSDNAVVPAVSHLDRPGKKVFDLMSVLSPTSATRQPPRDYDLAPDVPFNDLFSNWSGSYHASIAWVLGFSQGWSQNRGYARLFEANRFDYDRDAVYDPSTYDLYRPDDSVPSATDPNPPTNASASLVQTPFPPVDPFIRGQSASTSNRLDNPLFLDADCRPVADAASARYRLRYAVTMHDMSAALWMNTDMPWLSAARKQQVRDGYRDAIEAVGANLALCDSSYGGRVITNYSPTLENVFLGHGAYASSNFVNGVPTDWAERGGAAMAYRSPTGNSRVFYNVHGSMFRSWNEPTTWLGSALPSFNDLGFAVAKENQQWHSNSEAEPDGSNSSGQAVREDQYAQRVGTPFGRPYGAATDHPWAVNLLAVPARVLSAMVAAYVPPASRTVLATTEIQWPYRGGTFISTASGTWSIPAVDATPIAGVGIDLFTADYRPSTSASPFAAYPTPADRDYWYASAAARPDHRVMPDTRGNAERYPGEAFFSDPTVEGSKGNQMTVWSDVTADPRQVESDPLEPATNAVKAVDGMDHLARHIVFYRPGSPSLGTNDTYLSGYYRRPKASTSFPGRNYPVAEEFNPITPFGRDSLGYKSEGSEYNPSTFGLFGSMGLFSPSTTVTYTPPTPEESAVGEVYPSLASLVSGSEDDHTVVNTAPAARGGLSNWPGTTTVARWQIRRSSGDNCSPSAPNSYWFRLSMAFYHAVVVAQTANLSWADPQDARSQRFWVNQTTAGIMYNPTPGTETGNVRKGLLSRKHASDPKTADAWTPASAHYRTLEQIDRQLLANMGESFDQPGKVTPTQVAEGVTTEGFLRPPRYMRWNRKQSNDDPNPGGFAVGQCFFVGEYRVTNNIRTLLTPTLPLTASSTAAQGEPPRKLWLLDEWNAGGDSGYTPGATIGTTPTRLARARAKLMERVLNDWRMSFLGAAESYADAFRPKDFDGDGLVFCSGLPNAAVADADCGLTCYAAADSNGNGPGRSGGLSIFSMTGCLTIDRSHQIKIQVRGELYDNFTSRAVSEQYLESALLIDPDSSVVRSSGSGVLPTGMEDSQLIFQRPIHNYYQGYLNRSYP
jgi:hypothetical protein